MSTKSQPGGQRVAIVTDSSCDLPRDIVERYEIEVVPLLLHIGNRTWRDGLDIDPSAFYRLLESSTEFQTSSQPKASDFAEVFQRLSQDHDSIVAVLVSSGLSGTVNSALVAASNLPGVPIEIIDSRAVSMQLGFLVQAAGQAAAAGGSGESVADSVRAVIAKSHVFFVVDTLEYLHRGGRIGAAAKLFGSALDLKPVLGMQDGIVSPLARIRTRAKALRRLYELVADQLQAGDRSHMAVLHIAASAEAGALARQLESQFAPVELLTVECGPVVGAHAGPGTVGVAFYVE